jgi:flotillin
MVDIVQVVIAVLVIVIGTVGGLVLYAKRYVRVPPNMAMVVFGVKRQARSGGYRIVRGGGQYIVPIFEDYAFLSLNIRIIKIELPNVISDIKGGRQGINLAGVAQIKVASDEAGLETAFEVLLHKTDEEINEMARMTIEGHIRDSCATMKFEAIDTDRNEFAHKIETLVSGDLKKMGMTILSFVIKDIEKEKDKAVSQVPHISVDYEAMLKEILERVKKLETKIAKLEGEKID